MTDKGSKKKLALDNFKLYYEPMKFGISKKVKSAKQKVYNTKKMRVRKRPSL